MLPQNRDCEAGMAQACNPELRRLRQDNKEFKASLDYIVRPSLKKENS
jgi:hypothetical protein